MFLFQRIKIHSDEVGLRFRDREFVELLDKGTHWIFDPFRTQKIDVLSLRDPEVLHDDLDVIAKSGALDGRAIVLDLKDYERALVWIDSRFNQVLSRGLYAYWTKFRDVKVEVVDARTVRFEHSDLPMIIRSPLSSQVLEAVNVAAGHAGVVFIDGVYTETLPAGHYAFWKHIANVKVVQIDLRESMFDIAGQEIMTADKVTLRLNVAAVYRVIDARAAVSMTEDAKQSLYREVQLALRAAVVARDLDTFLADKDVVARQMEEAVARRAGSLGLEIIAVGIRDVILPGDMKDLMNKVTEAKKAAEANLIVRREETAAMRSQSNTAKLLEGNPTLMRLRELEVLEKIAAGGKLNIVLGEKGLAERVVNLI